jgi:hypothetical protein
VKEESALDSLRLWETAFTSPTKAIDVVAEKLSGFIALSMLPVGEVNDAK